jgi:hypothetical protein
MTPLAMQWVAVMVWGALWVRERRRLVGSSIIVGILLAVSHAMLVVWVLAR